MADVNGSLLITWFLETCQVVENKHSLLAWVLTHEEEFNQTSDMDEERDKAEKLNENNDEDHTAIHDDEKTFISTTDDGSFAIDKSSSVNGLRSPEKPSSREKLSSSSKFIKLCTLKLGTLSVLKLLNYRTNLSARDMVLAKIFGSDVFNSDTEEKNQATSDESLLRSILIEGHNNNMSANTTGSTTSNPLMNNNGASIFNGSSHGANFIHKILSVPTLEPTLKKKLIHKIKLVLTDITAEYGPVSNNSLRRLADECGIRGFNSVNNHHHRTASSSNGTNVGGSLATLAAWKSRSRSNSTNTNGSLIGGNGENSPPVFSHVHQSQQQHQQNNSGIDYDLLLRQQLDELSLNGSNKLYPSNTAKNLSSGMNFNNINVAMSGIGNLNNMNGMNSINGMNSVNKLNGLSNLNGINNMNMNNMNGINNAGLMTNNMNLNNGMNMNMNMNMNMGMPMNMNMNMNNPGALNTLNNINTVGSLNNINNMNNLALGIGLNMNQVTPTGNNMPIPAPDSNNGNIHAANNNNCNGNNNNQIF